MAAPDESWAGRMTPAELVEAYRGMVRLMAHEGAHLGPICCASCGARDRPMGPITKAFADQGGGVGVMVTAIGCLDCVAASGGDGEGPMNRALTALVQGLGQGIVLKQKPAGGRAALS